MDPVGPGVLGDPADEPGVPLPDRTPFPVFAIEGWRGSRYLAFHRIRDGRLREVTLGHGVRWSTNWFEVTSFAPAETIRNEHQELTKVATHRLEGTINDYEVRRLHLPYPNEGALDLPQGCVVDGVWCAFDAVVVQLAVQSASLVTPAGRGIVLTWLPQHSDDPLPPLSTTTTIEGFQRV